MCKPLGKALRPALPKAPLVRVLGWQCQEPGVQHSTVQPSTAESAGIQGWVELRNSILGGCQPTWTIYLFLTTLLKKRVRKKTPPDSPKEETKRETLRFLIPPESPSAGCKRGHHSHPAPPAAPPSRQALHRLNPDINKEVQSLNRKASFFSKPSHCLRRFLNKTLSCF